MAPTHRLRPVLAFVALLAAAGCGEPAPERPTSALATTTTTSPAGTCAPPGEPAGPGARVVRSGGRDRTVLVALPDDVGPTTPLVVSLHGHGGSAAEHDASTGLGAEGVRRGIAVVTPQGEGDPRRWNFDRRPDGPDDHAFVGDLIAALVDGGCADPDRVVLAGSSNGAAFAGLLACTPPYRAAAVVMVIATVPSGCPADVTPSILTIRGTADTHVPFAGTPEIVAGDAAHHGCDPTPQHETEGRVETTRHTGCRGGGEVTLVAVAGTAHVWPGSARDPDPGFDATTAVLDLAARTGAP